MIKPILIESDNPTNIWLCYNGYIIEGKCRDKDKLNHYCDIMLIDTEAEIVEGDWCLCDFKTGQEVRQNIYGAIGSTIGSTKYLKKKCHKIISSTNKSHSLPLISIQSIQLLINYYNEHKCMPESVKVKDDAICTVETYPNSEGKRVYPFKAKLNQQGEVDIALPEVEVSNEDELLLIIRRFKNHAEIYSWPSKSFKEKVTKLLNSKKK